MDDMITKQKHPGGRPRIEININLVESMCRIQCTGEEIAGAIGVDYDTLNARIKESQGVSFSEYFKKHSAYGKTSLRRMQWKAAQNGSVSMLIWLGKNMLGQTDKVEYETDESPAPIAINIQVEDGRKDKGEPTTGDIPSNEGKV